MAWVVHIVGLKCKGPHRELVELPGCIGDSGTLREDPRFRCLEKDQSYFDYFAVLTPQEAKDMARKFYEYDTSSEHDAAYEAFAKAVDRVSFVVAHVQEV